jgi:hypothetical protein
MPTRVRTTRGRTASVPAAAGAVVGNASASACSPLQAEGPRVLIRLPDLTAAKIPQVLEERIEPRSEQVESTEERAELPEAHIEPATEQTPHADEPWPENMIARTMPGMSTSNVIVQSFESLPVAEPKNELPRYVSLASAIHQLQVSEPPVEVQVVDEPAPKAESKSLVQKIVQAAPLPIDPKLTAKVVAALETTVAIAAPQVSRVRLLLVMARNPKMVLTGFLVLFIHLAIAMFFVPDHDPTTDAPSAAAAASNPGSNSSTSNVAPTWSPPTAQAPAPTNVYVNPAAASQSPAPAFVAPTFPVPAFPTPPSNSPQPSYGPPPPAAPAIGTGPSFNTVPSTATAPSSNQQSAAYPTRPGSQPSVAEFEGGIVRPTLEANHERARQSLR